MSRFLRNVHEATITSLSSAGISRDPENLVRLQAQAPPWVGFAVSNCQLSICRRVRAIHGLQQEMVEFQVLIQVWLGTTLREHELQFVATVNLQRCPRLWAHADPINAG